SGSRSGIETAATSQEPSAISNSAQGAKPSSRGAKSGSACPAESLARSALLGLTELLPFPASPESKTSGRLSGEGTAALPEGRGPSPKPARGPTPIPAAAAAAEPIGPT